ncbi:Hypothetical protein, putative [Bodo saltans]|uniref:Uncharacterized protein n=1 Tax=Bodo saltans TaxID=75058 RepID=A0A0S4IPV0_BODSA|nr:Hypothetical protein, putative [Bodo saltans]|eukprot:CUF15927.1 Hypothetical protein, putative [Bodo saltans]
MLFTRCVRVMEGQERHGRHTRLPDNIDSGTIWVELASAYLYDSAPHPIHQEEMCRRLKLRRTDTTKDVVDPSPLRSKRKE